MPPRGDLRLSDLAADAHRRGPRRDGEERRARAVRVHQRRERVRRDERGDRLLGRRRAHLHRHREPGPAVHGRGGLQRLGPRPADRDDGRQPRHRRADQHLERPQRLDEPARLRLDPAVRRDQPGGARPAHPGLQAGRGAVDAGDGVHGRLHPHPRLRARRHARRRPRSTPSCRRTSRARCSTRPSRCRSARWSGPRPSWRCATSRTPSSCRRSSAFRASPPSSPRASAATRAAWCAATAARTPRPSSSRSAR